MADVCVHHDSPQPRELSALAFARGRDIHLGPEGRHCLAHEAWHIVQQRQGRVRPTAQIAGTPVNDQSDLEREAEVMGQIAMRQVTSASIPLTAVVTPNAPASTAAYAAQRYTETERGSRISENKNILLLDAKSLWASDAVISASNQILANQSYVVLNKTSEISESKYGPKRYRVEPAWNNLKTPGGGARERLRLKRANAGPSGGFIAHSDCFMNAQTVMGVDDSPTGQDDRTRPYAHGPLPSVTAISRSTATEDFGATGFVGAVASNSPSRGQYKFLFDAFNAFFESLASENELDSNADSNADSPAQEFLFTFGRHTQQENLQGLTGLFRAYRALATEPKYAELLASFSSTLKINEYLSPQIGQGLAILNDPFERQDTQERIQSGEVSPDEELWNYHFAGVVMKDGNDYVTLENFSVGDVDADNANWLFQMYGQKQQSFHDEMSKAKGIGAAPMTLGFESAPAKRVAGRSNSTSSGASSTSGLAGLLAARTNKGDA